MKTRRHPYWPTWIALAGMLFCFALAALNLVIWATARHAQAISLIAALWCYVMALGCGWGLGVLLAGGGWWKGR